MTSKCAQISSKRSILSLQDLRQNQSPETIFEVRSARWPDGPPQSGVAHGFRLIPVSGVREAARDEKIGRNEFQGTFNKDLTNDGMIFEAHTESFFQGVQRYKVSAMIKDAKNHVARATVTPRRQKKTEVQRAQESERKAETQSRWSHD